MAGFRNVVKKIVQGGGGSTGEVDRERLQYDNRNTGKKATNTNSAAIAVAETSRMAVESVAAAVLGQDTVANRKAVEDISNTVTAPLSEISKKATDVNEAVIIPTKDAARKAFSDSATALANYAGYANQNVATTGYANPGNALGNTTTTAATLTATASGVGGLTSATTNGDIQLGLVNPSGQISDLSAVGDVTIQIERQVAPAGTLPLNQSYNIQYQYQIAGQGGGSVGVPAMTFTYNAAPGGTIGPAAATAKIIGSSAMPVFVAAATSTSSSVTVPQGVQDGDWLLIACSAPFTMPNPRIVIIGSNARIQLVYITLTAADSGQTFVLDTNNSGGELTKFPAAAVYRGVSSAAYIGDAQAASGSQTITTPGFVGNQFDLAIAGTFISQILGATPATDVTPPAGTTERAQFNGTSGNGEITSINDRPASALPAGWTTFASDVGTTAAVAKGFVSTTIPALTYNQLDNLQVRAVGTVISGTGLGASVVHSVFRARMTFAAQKTY